MSTAKPGPAVTNPKIPPEIRCWNVVLDVAGWQTDPRWAATLALGRFESLIRLRHRALALVIDLDWFDPDAPESYRGAPRSGGKFRLRVVQGEDWENPVDGFHIPDASGIDDALRRMIARYG